LKIVGISDLFIPSEYIRDGLKNFKNGSFDFNVLEWKLKDFEELQNINLQIEKGGLENFKAPGYILEALKNAEIIIAHFYPVTSEIIEHCKSLKIIGILRSGYENINVGYATEKGVLVFNTPGRNADAVADFTIGMMIAECRNIAKGHHGLKNGIWIRNYPNSGSIPDLPGKTAGIIGLGEIGRKVAKRLTGFDIEILGYDPYVKESLENVKMVSLEELFKRSDFVTIHVKAAKETEKMIGEKHFRMMKKNAYFINTSRASVVDEQALYKALKSKMIAGAALDVFEVEPPGKDYPMVTLENVTITPHMAGGSNDAFYNSPKLLAAEISNYLKGTKSRFIVNKELLVNNPPGH